MKFGVKVWRSQTRTKLISIVICIHVTWTTATSSQQFSWKQDGRHSRTKRSIASAAGNKAPPAGAMPRISTQELEKIVERARAGVERRLDTVEKNIYNNGIVLDPGSPAWFAAVSAKTKVVAKNVSKMALVAEETTKIISKMYSLDRNQILHQLPTVDVRGTELERECPITVDFPCRPKRYRAYSGYCNNVQNPRWGNANTAYVRYLSPDYADGIDVPRQSADGVPLVSSSQVSQAVHSDFERLHQHLTVFLAVFAEFVFHDIFHTSQVAGYKGQRIRCCDVPQGLLHPECLPIMSPQDNNNNRRIEFCVNYVRSSNVPRAGCTLGPREQVNQVTSYLDGSAIYGSSEEEVRKLRSGNSGLMKTQDEYDLLPADVANPYDCRSNASSQLCFVAGDIRVNENIGLMVIHTLWVRQHNRIARQLAAINPQWNDEQLFEETRRIIGAQLQHVTYSELLPSLLGPQVILQFDLQPLKSDAFYHGYDINLNPGAANTFASAVGASFYSMMPSHFYLYAQSVPPSSGGSRRGHVPRHSTVGSMPVGGTHFQPGPLYGRGAVAQFMLGMTNRRAQSMDEHITKEMNNNIYDERETKQRGHQMDLPAWIIQQGRDHGIAGYVEWRRICHLLPDIRNFTQLREVMSEEAALKISRVYRDVSDIDLFTGGLSEKPLVGGVMGPTFTCVMSRQFQHLRKGDRYWYENDMPPNAFTKDQLREIRKSSLARIVCDNAGDLIRMVQPSLMFMPDDFLNAFQECSTATSEMDLTKWKTVSPAYEIPKETLLTSLKEASRQAKKRIAAEQEIFHNNFGVADFRSAQAVHHVFLRPKRQATLISNMSLILELASHQYMKDIHLRDLEKKPSAEEISAMMLALSMQDVEDYLHQQEEVPLGAGEGSGGEGRCRTPEARPPSQPCDHTTPFRSASGWCNNLQQPHWGKALVTFQRILTPRYHDGVSAPRSVGVRGQPLPSPRLVSFTVHYDTDAPHSRYTLALMQWGQFLDHDLTLTPMHDALGRRPLDCKSCQSATSVHPECFPITIPQNDPFFPSVNRNTTKNCISFARSLAGQLTLGRREQLNQVTSYLDASNVYGSDWCESRMLRTFQGGRLNSTKHPSGVGKDLLPQDTTNVECRAPSGICFESGDIRASEQPGLTSMHTIWMREHNRLADALSVVNQHWDDEITYQNVRRILSAMMQHITFNEFLPRVLGESELKRLELSAARGHEYDPTCEATIFNEFATAAYRFGHTLLKPLFQRLTAGYSKTPEKQPIRLRTAFFNPDALYEAGAIDEVLRGLLSSSVEVFDHSITSEVTNHLFENRHVPFSGMDLVSLNLQRGRDHGLAPYNEYRVFCNKTRANDFDDLLEDIPDYIVQRLKVVYSHVDDIDLFTGGVAERPMYGALVGPTFGCIIARQFIKLRNCDRFWYETQDPFLRFSQDQLSEIRKTRLSKVICDNSDSIASVQLAAFDLPENFLNPRMTCKSVPGMDMTKWRAEAGTCTAGGGAEKVAISMGHASRVSPCAMCACTKEGLVCQSLKISNCFQLASKYTRQAILEDDVCKVQCAFAFRAYPQFESNLDNVLGFSVNE